MLGVMTSPLPWHAKHDGDEVQIGDAHGKFVAMTLECNAESADELDYNNALMIAHAVSNYDALRTTLAELIDFVVTCDVQHPALRDAKSVMNRVRNEEDLVRAAAREHA